MTCRGRLFAVVLLCLHAVAGLDAQEYRRKIEPKVQKEYTILAKPVRIEVSTSREASAQALELMDAGKWDDATETLLAARSSCAAGEAGRQCRLLLNYSLGYGYQRRYGELRDPVLLAQAEGFYRRVLAEEPGHSATTKNLALVRMEAGDLAWREGDLESALELFRESAVLNPASAAARRRIVGVYERLDGERAVELLEELDEWTEQFPDVARRGYAMVVDRTWRQQPRVAGRAMRSYAALLAAEGGVSEKALAGLPEDWEPVIELRQFMVSGEWPSSRWWGPDQDLSVDLARRLGNEWLAQGRSELTEACWWDMLGSAPNGDLSGAWLALLGDLAALYTNRPELDPEGHKFERLEDVLFAGKGRAYRVRDREAIQRFHTVLGLIYADRGKWTDSTWDPKGAIYQLSRALETATERRERGEASYQPQPELRKLLAEGYSSIGDPRAYDQYLDAARAYLDTDDLGEAAKMLVVAREAPGRSPERVDESQLETVVELRRSARQAPAEACRRADQTFALLGRDNTDFVSRQRFKALTDCAAGTAASNDSLTYSAQALTAALDGKVTLVGAADMLRIQQLRDKLETASAASVGLVPGSYSLSTSAGTGRVLVDVPSGRELPPMVYVERRMVRSEIDQ